MLGRSFPARWVAKKYPDLYTMYYAVSTVCVCSLYYSLYLQAQNE